MFALIIAPLLQNVTPPGAFITKFTVSVKGDNSNQQDALYLADGPWGIDYDSDQVVIENFNIESQVIGLNGGNYEIERDVKVAGNVKGTMNVFRNLLPGDLVFDATPYKNIEFEVVNNFPIEVILVTEGLTDWNNRLRYIIPENFKTVGHNSMAMNKITVDQVFNEVKKFI